MATRLRYLYPIHLVVIAWILYGCATIKLRDAQDHFNKGAEIESRALDTSLLSDNPSANPSDAFAAVNEYRMANAVTTELIAEHAAGLKKDQLLGATYILKAMALWRVADLEGNALADGERPTTIEPAKGVANSRQELLAVLNLIEKQKTNNTISLGTRDQVLHKALYGFYDHDGGRASDDYVDAREWFQSAIKRLHEAVSSNVPERHPVRVYIGSAKLRTLAAWRHARFNEAKRCSVAAEEHPSCALLAADKTTIIKQTQAVVCRLQPFWDDNEGIKDQLTILLVPLGLPNAFRGCSS